MLNILQTGDLHLGKVLYDYSLIEDQKHMLQAIIDELNAFSYDALFIAGDVYDRSIPSPEAISLFDEFLISVNQSFPNLSVCIISGNHDSSTRLSYASTFLKSKNIFISTQAEDCDKPIYLYKDDKIKAVLYQVPFLQAGSLRNKQGEILKNQSDLIEEAIERITIFHTQLEKTQEQKIPCLLNCHLFTLKGSSSDSERLFLGNAELIDPMVFKDFFYTSIGHLHKKQKVAQNAYYAGSPLAYSFSEVQTEKCILRVELHSDSVSVTPISIKPLRKLVQIEAQFEDFEKMVEHKNNFIEFTCTNSVPLENIASRLRKVFPYLLSVKQKAITSMYKNNEERFMQKKELLSREEALPLKEILCSFLQSIEVMSEEETPDSQGEWKESIALFEQIAKEIEATET